jgi:hypothetical protein
VVETSRTDYHILPQSAVWHIKALSARDLADTEGAFRKRSERKKAPGLRRGLFLTQLGQLAYREAAVTGAASLLTLMLAPPPGAPLPGSPGETTLTQSSPLSLKYEVSLALRSASRLFCGVPEAAVVNPGRSKITHEPFSISVTERATVGLSVVTLISVPARTVPFVTV